jgi:hypothetical protein
MKKIRILFPCEYGNLKKVDDNFLKEYNTCQSLKIDVALFDHDLFVEKQRLVSTLTENDEDIILRGWMLNAVQYHRLYRYIQDNQNSRLINNHFQYEHCHYFPNVFHDVIDYTPGIVVAHEKDITDELLETIHSDIASDMIIKDFVKSEKGTDLFKINSNITCEDFKKFVYDFIDARKPLFNEGIVLKKWVNLKKDLTGKNANEWRAFFLNGSLISLDPNSEYLSDRPSPDHYFVCEVASNIKKSNFFTIDFAMTEEGEWIVLECGDGQVSGLALHANEFEFYQHLIEKI